MQRNDYNECSSLSKSQWCISKIKERYKRQMTLHRECGQGSTTADADGNINKRKGRSVVRVNHGTFGITPSPS